MSTSLPLRAPLLLTGCLLLDPSLPAPFYLMDPMITGRSVVASRNTTSGTSWAQTHWRSLRKLEDLKLYKSHHVLSYPKQQGTLNHPVQRIFHPSAFWGSARTTHLARYVAIHPSQHLTAQSRQTTPPCYTLRLFLP